MLFDLPAGNLLEQREERRRTIIERCEKLAELMTHERPAVVWCHLNDEGDLLEKIIPGAVQISGKDSDEKKERVFQAFSDGDIRCLVTKPKIGAWGLNWQHASDVGYFPSHSYESYYQSVRRCWRFGQQREVTVNVVLTEGETRIMENLQRKAGQASEMFANLIKEMGQALSIDSGQKSSIKQEHPSWL
jgi:hypothetical protein